MIKRNANVASLPAGYLFPEINKRKNIFLDKCPDAEIISMGIGDTPGPLPKNITAGLTEAAQGMGTSEGYSGYPELGLPELKELINQRFYNNQFKNNEIFVADGSKCDVARLLFLFGSEAKIAVQNPVYPAYVDSAVIVGGCGDFNKESQQFENIIYLDCTPDNDFFPDLTPAKDADLLFFCSPNNPTGATATKAQLEELVKFARDNQIIILFDAAYSVFINDQKLPSTIFDIQGAREVALEMNSFSKFASYTGMRLGWTVIPDELKFADGTPVQQDWNRVMNTVYNGNCHVTQKSGISVLQDAGWQECQEMVAEFMENARLVKEALAAKGLEVYAGDNAPYIWVRIPGKTSWEAFDHILENAHVVCTPGSGFGSAGEGFVRFSAFNTKDKVIEAISRLNKAL